MLHDTVGVLSKLERGAAMRAVGTATRRVASWRMRVTSLKMEFVIAPLRFVDETKSAMMSSSQGLRHTKLWPDMEGLSHTPPEPRPKALQNTRWVGSRQMILDRCMGRAGICTDKACQSTISQ